MKIVEVKIKNFRGYGVNIGAKDGFYSFNELNTSKFIIFNGFNGFGKTSFFEAVEWCMTNTVKRLSSFEANDSKTNLRGNHYLTFISKDGSQREAEVTIIFDNNTIVKRTTTSKSLQANDYNSNTHLYINEEEVAIDLDYISRFSLRKIYTVNFLGQETILDLLRKDKPEERSSKFLSLIDLNVLNSIQNNSRNNNFGSKIDKADEEIKKLSECRTTANELLKRIGAESVESYLANIEAERKSLVSIIDTLTVPEIKSFFQSCVELKEVTIDNCLDLVDIINNKSAKIKERLQILLQEKQSKEESENTSKAITLFTRINKLNSIKKTNCGRLLEAFSVNESRVESINVRLKELTNASLDLQKYISNLPWHIYSSQNDNIEYVLTNGLDVNILNESIRKFDIQVDIFNNLDICIKEKEILDSLTSAVAEIKSISKTLVENTVLELNKKITTFNYENKKKLYQIKEKENNLALFSKLNSAHAEVLQKASEFISSQKDLNECPLCLSTDFSSAETKLELPNSQNNLIKEQLLNIISKQISGGDEAITNLHKEIEELKLQQKKSQENITQELNIQFVEHLHMIISEEDILLKSVNKIVNIYSQRIEGIKNNCEVITSNLRLSIDKYKTDYKLVFNEEYEISKKNIDQSLIEEEERRLSKLLELLNSEKDEENKVYTLESLIKLRDLLPQVDSNIKLENLSAKIKDCSKLLPVLNTWSRFNLTTDEKQVLKGIIRYEKSILHHKKVQESLSIDKTIVETISSNVSKKKDEMLQQLFQNQLIKYIYQEINPHYRFNDITLENKNSGQSNKNYIKFNDVHLNQIFSAAQLNIISLSIFMGMGLPEKNSGLQQLFLDDPIQSMDDMNVLALIDIFRNLIDLPNAKNIILSTHDDNFAQLLKIKMRNKNIKIFDFVSYGDEGPIITNTNNQTS